MCGYVPHRGLVPLLGRARSKREFAGVGQAGVTDSGYNDQAFFAKLCSQRACSASA